MDKYLTAVILVGLLTVLAFLLRLLAELLWGKPEIRTGPNRAMWFNLKTGKLETREGKDRSND